MPTGRPATGGRPSGVITRARPHVPRPTRRGYCAGTRGSTDAQADRTRPPVRGDAGIELALHQATQPVFPLERDHQNLQKMQDLSPEDGAVFFERLRKNYPLRSEFSSQKVRLEPMDINIAMTLSAFRFEVVG